MADDVILFERGDTISFTGTWGDETAAGMDLTGHGGISVFESSVPAIQEHGVCTITNAAVGRFSFKLPDQYRAEVPVSALTTLRLIIQLPDGSFDASPLMRIKIQ